MADKEQGRARRLRATRNAVRNQQTLLADTSSIRRLQQQQHQPEQHQRHQRHGHATEDDTESSSGDDEDAERGAKRHKGGPDDAEVDLTVAVVSNNYIFPFVTKLAEFQTTRWPRSLAKPQPRAGGGVGPPGMGIGPNVRVPNSSEPQKGRDPEAGRQGGRGAGRQEGREAGRQGAASRPAASVVMNTEAEPSKSVEQMLDEYIAEAQKDHRDEPLPPGINGKENIDE
jgi:hypothetical protein